MQERVPKYRPPASTELLEGYARKLRDMARHLDPEDDLGCAICGIGPHVAGCPVPALRTAEAQLRAMAAVATSLGGDTRLRGVERGAV
jgi:hypothetical protein